MSERIRPFPHYKFPDEIIIECKKMTDDECSWYNAKKGSYGLRTTNYGWFPTDVLMGVVNNTYTDTKGIGATISGNLGTAGMAVLNITTACELLKEAGYNVIML